LRAEAFLAGFALAEVFTDFFAAVFLAMAVPFLNRWPAKYSLRRAGPVAS